MKNNKSVREVQEWFESAVTYEGEAYVIDAEQAKAVISEAKNTIVVARAGSGKTRTIVARIVYLVAKCGVRPEEIMAFVFNANAAKEINERLGKMYVDGVAAITGEVKIANTFHAFARGIVYEACGGKEKCGKILAGEKEAYMMRIVQWMMKKAKWERRVRRFIKGDQGSDKNGGVKEEISEAELKYFAKMMALFVNRAQQKFLGGEMSLGVRAKEYLRETEVGERERVFVELGVECFKWYHWYLLDAPNGLKGFSEYGTDFNLIVSWASRLILAKRGKVKEWLADKKYILIDEYQDFSQLFLATVMAIREVAVEAKLFVVGDDLQAINRFAGSEVEFFKGFEKYFTEECRRCEIATNYRCDRMIVSTARRFMRKAMGNKGEFRAHTRRLGRVAVVNPRKTECGVALVPHDQRVDGRDRIYYSMALGMLGRAPERKTVQVVKTLVEIIQKNRKAKQIMILHRNNETNIEGASLVKIGGALRWGLEKLGVMKAEEYDNKVCMMTMHKSKGLEAEVVIILEADEGVIPKTHPDTRLYAIFGETEEVALDDQKRLFYVAMTRAKKRLYIIHDENAGAGFVKFLGQNVEK